MEVLVAGIGRLISLVITLAAGERHRFTIDVDRDSTEGGDAQTVLVITNAGNRWERNVTVRAQVAVQPEDYVRFITVQSEDDDLVEIEKAEHRTFSKLFTTYHLILEVDGLQKGHRILIRMLSNEYLNNIQVRIMSDKASKTYDSRRHDTPWTALSTLLRRGEP